MPKEFTTEGIILKRRDFAERDRELTILTRTHGLIRALAKGARLPKSKLVGVVEPFTHAEYKLVPGRSFHYITGASHPRAIIDKDNSQEVARVAYDIANILLKVIKENDTVNDIFSLTEESLESIKIMDPIFVLYWFKLHFLYILGYAPDLEVRGKGKLNISVGEGGLSTSAHDSISVQAKTVKLLHLMLTKRAGSFKSLIVPKEIESEMRKVIDSFMWYYTDV